VSAVKLRGHEHPWAVSLPQDDFAGRILASAADAHNTLAMLVRRDGETRTALLQRLHKAVGMAYDGGDAMDEVNRCSA